ncbi:hypothetical protein DL95DRAFT_390270 [Leptodontidium sp. 2 PMI_412]|nr:hypothetical protein DL95DRAFT_390270 [Leptodontidium sp. 2 PMI_412]
MYYSSLSCISFIACTASRCKQELMCGHLPKTKLTLSKLQQILFRLRLSETLPYYGQGKSQACFTKYGSTIKFKDDKWAGPTVQVDLLALKAEK